MTVHPSSAAVAAALSAFAVLAPATASALVVEVRAVLNDAILVTAGEDLTGDLVIVARGDSTGFTTISNGIGIFDALPVQSVQVESAGELSDPLSLAPGDAFVAISNDGLGFFVDLPGDGSSEAVLLGFTGTNFLPAGFAFDVDVPETATSHFVIEQAVGFGVEFPLDFPGLGGSGLFVVDYGTGPTDFGFASFFGGAGTIEVSVAQAGLVDGAVPLPAAAPLLGAAALALAGLARRRRS